MTGTDRSGAAGGDDPGTGIDAADADWLRALLTDLADDPDAPQSTVSPLSVIAAARSSATPAADEELGPPTPLPVIAAAESSATPAAADETADEVLPPPTPLRSRRRTVLTALVAAACVFGVGVVVLPLAFNDAPTVTSSSADANRIAEAPPSDAGGASDAGAADESAAELAQGSAAAAAPEAAGRPDASVPAEAGSADSGTVDVNGPPSGCWPPLDAVAAAALLAALPDGAYGLPGALAEPCDPAAVAGAVVIGAGSAPAVLVRVTRAAPGACAASAGGCVPADGGGYLGTDAAGAPIAYWYAGGFEVAVGSVSQTPGSVLPESQALGAAQAVAAALP